MDIKDNDEDFLDSICQGKYYTPKTAAQILDVDDTTIRRWVSANKLPHIRIGAAIRIREDHLREFVIRNHPLINEG
jgi:excisionase family DNA binding protein